MVRLLDTARRISVSGLQLYNFASFRSAAAMIPSIGEVTESGDIAPLPLRRTDEFNPGPEGAILELSNSLATRVLYLHRAKVLNALTESMCIKMSRRVRELIHSNSNVECIVLCGTGPKAFCAGGDVRKVYSEGPAAGEAFFKAEYDMDLLMGTFPPSRTLISVLDGITMGGGVGIAIHGRVRIASEKTVFAMPECAIGLHPDVGMSYFLPRLPGALGLYLALTGARVTGIDNLKAGIATHYVESSRVAELVTALAEAKSGRETISLVEKFEPRAEVAGSRSQYGLFPDRDEIDKHFSHPGVQAIMESLASSTHESKFARTALSLMRANSPTSMMVTFESLRRGLSYADLKESLEMDRRLTRNCALPGRDFYEGVRAKLVDKDNCPRWQPDSVEQVKMETVLSYFK